jgi:hypothetical protein
MDHYRERRAGRKGNEFNEHSEGKEIRKGDVKAFYKYLFVYFFHPALSVILLRFAFYKLSYYFLYPI